MDKRGFLISVILSFAYLTLSQPLLESSNPPLLKTKKEINEVLSDYVNKSDQLALFLDYDGTLGRIHKNSTFNQIDPDSQAFLRGISEKPNIFTVVISGREVYDVKNRTGINTIVYSGDHGFQILYQNGTLYTYPVPQEYRDNFPKLVRDLRENIAKNGAWVKEKMISLSYHYSELPEKYRKDYLKQAQEISEYYGYTTFAGHDLLAITPPIDWNKGNASDLILNQHFGNEWKENRVKVIFAGDDTTDEYAMKALKGNALTFRISHKSDVKTSASYVVPTYKSVTDILQWINGTL